MTTPAEIYREMLERCDEVRVFHRPAHSDTTPSASIGTIIRLENDAFMTIEVGLTDEGIAHATVRTFDQHGEPKVATVLDAGDGSVYITA